jgi:hypothetical protein
MNKPVKEKIMKRKITLSLALALSLTILLLTSSDSGVGAQNQTRFSAGTGPVTLGPNQVLRITVNSREGNDQINIRLREIRYAASGTTAGITKLAAASQETSEVITLAAGEAVSLDTRRCVSPLCGGVFVRVLSDSRDVRVNASIIDNLTGEVVSFTTDLVIDLS